MQRPAATPAKGKIIHTVHLQNEKKKIQTYTLESIYYSYDWINVAITLSLDRQLWWTLYPIFNYGKSKVGSNAEKLSIFKDTPHPRELQPPALLNKKSVHSTEPLISCYSNTVVHSKRGPLFDIYNAAIP